MLVDAAFAARSITGSCNGKNKKIVICSQKHYSRENYHFVLPH